MDGLNLNLFCNLWLVFTSLLRMLIMSFVGLVHQLPSNINIIIGLQFEDIVAFLGMNQNLNIIIHCPKGLLLCKHMHNF